MQSSIKVIANCLNAMAHEYAASRQTNLTDAIKHVAWEETQQLGFHISAHHYHKIVLKNTQTQELIEAYFEASEEGEAGFYPVHTSQASVPWQQNLATLGSSQAIMQFIRNNTIEVTHNGVTHKFFNAMPHTVRLGIPVDNGRGVHQIARVESSGYIAEAIVTEHVDSTTTLTTVRASYDCNTDVLTAIATVEMYDKIRTLMTAEAAKGFHTAGYTPILIEFGVYHWDRFAVYKG